MALPGLFGGQQPQDGGQSPLMTLLTGLLAASSGSGGSAAQTEGSSGMIGMLGNLLAGAGGGGILSSGLQQLLAGFQQSGQGDKVDSWISTGPNKAVAPHEVGHALGEDRIQSLMQQTGMPRDELLSQLSANLPQLVDRLTPKGRIPTRQEAAQYIH